MSFTITRRIGIDAGHRIATHGSKCRHLHGHRYTIEATCRATVLRSAGEQTDMVLDFGFLKDEMLRHIDVPCDHGLILSVDDADMLSLFCPAGEIFASWQAALGAQVAANGHEHEEREEQRRRDDGRLVHPVLTAPRVIVEAHDGFMAPRITPATTATTSTTT